MKKLTVAFFILMLSIMTNVYASHCGVIMQLIKCMPLIKIKRRMMTMIKKMGMMTMIKKMGKINKI